MSAGQPETAVPDAGKIAPTEWPCVQVKYIEQPSRFQRTFLDWTVPWWVSPLLYSIVAAGWAMCIYTMFLYGATFTDDQVCMLPPMATAAQRRCLLCRVVPNIVRDAAGIRRPRGWPRLRSPLPSPWRFCSQPRH